MLEVGLPEELFDGTFYDPDRFVDAWDATDGNKMVLVEWGREGDEFDPATQVIVLVASTAVQVTRISRKPREALFA